MNVLVTGGEGFVGQALVSALLKNKHEVVVLDDYSASSPDLLRPKTSRRAGGGWQYAGSVTDREMLDMVIKKHRVDRIFHLAVRNISVSEIDPPLAFSVNAGGTSEVLRAADRHGVRQVIYTSTSSVYGSKPSQIPSYEVDQVDPRTTYSIAKYAGELICKSSKVLTTILRLSNVYGPGQTPRLGNATCGVVGQFMDRLSSGEPIIVYGDGTATRDYTHIDDVVRAMLLVLDDPQDGVFNVSTGEETSTNQLIALLEKVTGKTAKIDRRENRSIDAVVPRRCVDYSKIRNMFGWKPAFSLEAGLKDTWKWW